MTQKEEENKKESIQREKEGHHSHNPQEYYRLVTNYVHINLQDTLQKIYIPDKQGRLHPPS